jgi:hypothetical protein
MKIISNEPKEAINDIFKGEKPADLRTFKLPSWCEILIEISIPKRHDPSRYVSDLWGIIPKIYIIKSFTE